MVSAMKGPIPPHPYYDKEDSSGYVDRPVPRVRPEAQDIATKHHGSVGVLLQIEGQRFGSASRRYKPEPKDHMRENIRRMRKIQRQSKVREEETKKPVKALWKSNKYDEVGSRVRETLDMEPPAPRPHSANYLRAHSRTGFVPSTSRPSSAEPPEDKLSVPKADIARDVKLIRRDVDFIKVNGKAARAASMKRSPSLTALDDLKARQDEEQHTYRRGEVPNYLRTRKEQWYREAEERKANEPDPEMPPGHRLMPPEERKNTLEKLRQTHTELLRQLAALPIRTDTVRVRHRKEEIEKKLSEVEEATKIFSRQKVFVKVDD